MSLFLARVFGGSPREAASAVERMTIGSTATQGAKNVARVIKETNAPQTPPKPKVVIVPYKRAEQMAVDNFNRCIQEISEERLAKEQGK